MSAVGSILKGAGKKVGTKIKGKINETFPKMGDPNRINKYIQRMSGKALENPDTITHSILPYHIANQYGIPIALGITAVTAGVTGFKMHNQSKLGDLSSGGLSNMTDGGIAGASASVINPYIKQLQDTSSREATIRSNDLANNMRHNISTSGAEGDIVFALHNMR